MLKANPAIKILDMSADFRLRDPDTYAQWYGHEHRAPELQGEAVYGLTEFYREQIAAARLVACPGCYPTAVLLALVPLVKAGLDRRARHRHRRQVGRHRRRPRAEAEHAVRARPARGCRPIRSARIATRRRSSRKSASPPAAAVTVNFTPHLIPMARGELCTCYVRLDGATRRRSARGAGGGLSRRAVRACREEGRAAADPERARLELCADRRRSPTASRAARS